MVVKQYRLSVHTLAFLDIQYSAYLSLRIVENVDFLFQSGSFFLVFDILIVLSRNIRHYKTSGVNLCFRVL